MSELAIITGYAAIIGISAAFLLFASIELFE